MGYPEHKKEGKEKESDHQQPHQPKNWNPFPNYFQAPLLIDDVYQIRIEDSIQETGKFLKKTGSKLRYVKSTQQRDKIGQVIEHHSGTADRANRSEQTNETA